VLFFPVALVLVASLGAVLVHARLMGRVGRSLGSDGVLGIARAPQWSWAVLPALGVALLVVTPPFGNLVLPLLVSPRTGTGTAGSACSTTPTASTSSSPTPGPGEGARLIVLRDDGATRVEFSR
jgi:hypothetical protein